ncbi:Uncharacterized protein ChrSV_1962 [Chromobacterium vaccinii]|nr:Uncharacterized protein ChrSW_1962 [Chromobacterium vaccinii]QND89420.1 Uncharacterized protein ChrSV_1962 [Chromobacterium vaccinii]
MTLIPADKVKEHADAEDSFRSTIDGYKRVGKKSDSTHKGST